MRNRHWIGENRCCRSNRLHRRASWGNSNVTRVWSCGHCDEQVEEQFVLAYSTCIKRANMAALFRIRHNCLCSITLCHASFHLSRFRSILLLVCDLLFQHRICPFFPLSHLRYIHQEYGNSGSTPGGAGKHNFFFFPSLTHVLLNVTVHQKQLCENILDEVRFAFTDDARTRRAIVVPLVVLIELRGNKSDFSPAFGLMNWQGRWTQATGIFMHAQELFQECGHGRWPLYHQIIPADNCLLLLLPGVNTAVYVCLHKECV